MFRLKRIKFRWKYLGLALAGLVGLFLLAIFVIRQPSNNRNWEFGFQTLPKVSINGRLVSVNDLRDYHYDIGKTISSGYINKTVDASQITKVWFVFEPFIVKPFTSFTGVAHTYFVFDFANSEPIVISVEARRQKGQKYDAWQGMFNQYEMMYIWGTEQDETVRRVVVENNKLFMYPLNISSTSASQLFLQLAQVTHSLETQPRFYNTFTSNCTNELAKSANKVSAGAIPFNLSLFLPGYSVDELYKLGFISHDLPLDQTNKKYYISDLVRKYYQQSNFSDLLRQSLQ